MEVFQVMLDLFGGAIISLPLTVVFLLLTDKQRFHKKRILVILFVLYLNAMFIIVGVPDVSNIWWHPTFNIIPFSDFSPSNIVGMFLNIALFIPFGGFITLYFKEFQKWYKVTVTGFLMSLLIEILQLATYRATDIDDLIMNTLGTIVGYGIAKTILKNSLEQESKGDKKKLLGMVLLTLMTIIFFRYPFIEYLHTNFAIEY